MVTQLDHLTALRNRYKREREELQAKVQEKDDLIASVEALIRHETGKPIAIETAPPARKLYPIQEVKPAVPVTKLLKDFLLEKKPGERFRNPDVVRYINSKGFTSEHLDSSSYETLRRMVQKGELAKDGVEFVVPKTNQEESNATSQQGDNHESGKDPGSH